MKKLVIYGNGAMAKVIAAYVQQTRELVAFTVAQTCFKPEQVTFCGLPLVDFAKLSQLYPPEQHEVLIAVGFSAMNRLRESLYAACCEQGYGLASYKHAAATAWGAVSIADNTVILDHVSIHPDSHIGAGTFISSQCNVGHDCHIEPFNWLNAGVKLAGGVTLGAGCFLGINASVAQGVTLGPHTFVGANTLITQDTEADSVYLSAAGEKFRLNSQAFLRFAGL